MKKSICAIIVTYRIGKGLLRCFDSIETQVEEVIVVDNGADKETISILKSLEKMHPNVKVFYNKENLGIAAALNIGVRYAIQKGYMWILTLDHDSEATTHMVEKLFNAYRTLCKQGADNIAVVAANPLDKNIQEYLIGEKLPKRDGEVEEVQQAISSGSLINSRVFEKVGFFNESLFLYYVDDDFCLRCKNNKWRIYICHSAVLLHREGAKEIKRFLCKKCIYRKYGFRAMYYISRNTIYMLRNHFKYRRYCYYAVKRICIDTIKIVLFDENRIKLIRFMMKGISDGVMGKYGKHVT